MDKLEFTYRRATLDDIPVLVENRIIFLLEIQEEKTPEEINKLRKELYDYFVKAIPSQEFIGYIAEYNQTQVGFGGLVIQSIPPSFSILNGSIGYILNMFTLKEFRGQGICNNIMDMIMATAKEKCIKKLYLNATKDGYEIYKKKGFHSPTWIELELKL